LLLIITSWKSKKYVTVIASKPSDRIGSGMLVLGLGLEWPLIPWLDAVTHAVVQQLALTREACYLSPTQFSAKFMKTLHDVGPPGYSTVAAYANVSPIT